MRENPYPRSFHIVNGNVQHCKQTQELSTHILSIHYLISFAHKQVTQNFHLTCTIYILQTSTTLLFLLELSVMNFLPFTSRLFSPHVLRYLRLYVTKDCETLFSNCP